MPFSAEKQEPIEEVVKEALENIGELEEETAPVPVRGKFEAECSGPIRASSNLMTKFGYKDSLADVEEQLVPEELESSNYPRRKQGARA